MSVTSVHSSTRPERSRVPVPTRARRSPRRCRSPRCLQTRPSYSRRPSRERSGRHRAVRVPRLPAARSVRTPPARSAGPRERPPAAGRTCQPPAAPSGDPVVLSCGRSSRANQADSVRDASSWSSHRARRRDRAISSAPTTIPATTRAATSHHTQGGTPSSVEASSLGADSGGADDGLGSGCVEGVCSGSFVVLSFVGEALGRGELGWLELGRGVGDASEVSGDSGPSVGVASPVCVSSAVGSSVRLGDLVGLGSSLVGETDVDSEGRSAEPPPSPPHPVARSSIPTQPTPASLVVHAIGVPASWSLPRIADREICRLHLVRVTRWSV